MKVLRSLIGIHEELDKAVKDLAVFGNRYQDMHPAAGGDVSQVFSKKASRFLIQRFSRTATRWFKINVIQELADIRSDGRSGYRSEGVRDPRFYKLVKPLGCRVMAITCTGSQIPAILETLHGEEDGRYLNLVEIGKSGDAIRVLYGNREFGTIPSIELHVHMLACAICLTEGMETPAAVHAHPTYLNLLGMHPRINGDFKALNVAIYTQIEGLNRNAPDLIGVVPYRPSGSAALVSATIDSFLKHHLTLWMNHGFVSRSLRIERAYALLAYAEQATEVTLSVLRDGGRGLPFEYIEDFLHHNRLLAIYRRLRLKSSHA